MKDDSQSPGLSGGRLRNRRFKWIAFAATVLGIAGVAAVVRIAGIHQLRFVVSRDFSGPFIVAADPGARPTYVGVMRVTLVVPPSRIVRVKSIESFAREWRSISAVSEDGRTFELDHDAGEFPRSTVMLR